MKTSFRNSPRRKTKPRDSTNMHNKPAKKTTTCITNSNKRIFKSISLYNLSGNSSLQLNNFKTKLIAMKNN